MLGRFCCLMCLSLCVLSQEAGCEADRVWESLVQARGGHDALMSVDAISIRWQQAARNHRSAIDFVTLWALPDLQWSWSYFGSQRLGSMAVKRDARRQLEQVNLSGSAQVQEQALEDTALFTQLILFLPETRFYKPILERCSVDPLRNDQFDLTVRLAPNRRSGESSPIAQPAVLTQLHVRRADGVLLAAEQKESRISTGYRFGNYQRFNGLNLPTRLERIDFQERRLEFRVSYDLNPRYDPEVFRRDPNAAAGPERWRLK